jgi:hypothetical protein
MTRAADTDWLADTTTALLAGDFAALGQTWPKRSPDDLFPAEL